MESPKRGCDLGPCVVKRLRSKKHCDRSLRFKDFPRCQGLRSKNAAFAFAVLSPLRSRPRN